jgi:hypothetical protein
MIKLDHKTLVKDTKLGFYEINNKIYWDKATAVMEGTKAGLGYNDLRWNFNDQEFSSWNWSEEPPGSIKDYYHARARHLRDKYDYLILNCSGGADSTTMLYSFIQQGLFIDEVFVRYAGEGTKKYNKTDKEFDASNEFSEFEYAAVPLLNWLKQVSPRTKITLHDFSLDIINDNLTWDENFIHWCGDYVTPGCIVRYTHTDKDSLTTFDKGKSIGILFGTDKPRLAITPDGYLVTFFGDRAVSSAIPTAVNNGYTNTHVELFYWSPDAVPLMIKQCHVLKNWFQLPDNRRLQYMLNTKWLLNSMNRTLYELVIKGIIYPDYDLTTFQCNKPVKTVFQEWDYWMSDFKATEGFNTFLRGVAHLYNNTSKDFFKIPDTGSVINGHMDMMNWEYKICSSQTYTIGKI